MAQKIFLLFMPLILMACTSTGITVFVPPTPTATPTITATPEPSAVASVPVQATGAPGLRICTGMEGGFLNVRSCAGTGCKSIAVLREGRELTPAGIEEETPSGRWLLITAPAHGWVNASFVCKE